MKFRTIANERTNLFYLKLKRSYLKVWYFNQLIPFSHNKDVINGNKLKKEFKIDRIAFFRKHIWCHFVNFKDCGWILLKFFRKNYCRLDIHLINVGNSFNYFWQTILILYKYKKHLKNIDKIIHLIHAKYSIYAKYPYEFSRFLVTEVGTFKDLSYKSTRRIRSQIRRQRPVILWVRGFHSHRLQSIIIVGFNRRLFFFFDPLSNAFKVITQKQLLKIWKKADYQGISC